MVVRSSTRSNEVTKRLAEHLIACNVYISVGRSKYASMLVRLLEDAQTQCANLRGQAGGKRIVMVHAYADGPYNRSSFHLAGTPYSVASVASRLARNATQALVQLQPFQSNEDSMATWHPTVGLVDHIAVMPLVGHDGRQLEDGFSKEEMVESGLELNSHDTTMPRWNVPSGWVARSLGHTMEKAGVDVLYYGMAHPDRLPLATVRRESTQFFHALPHHDTTSSSTQTRPRQASAGKSTVGAPPYFVENYNVRLSSHCQKEQARALSKRIRARDGGLPGVEALTLPYSANRWEVACNLTRLDQTTARDIQDVAKEWEKQQQQQQQQQQKHRHRLVELGYRVGTNRWMCLEALEKANDEDAASQRDQEVREKFRTFLGCDQDG